MLSKQQIREMDILSKVRQEIRSLEIATNHVNIMKLYDVFDISNDQIWLVTEYCNGGDLHDYLLDNCIHENQAKGIQRRGIPLSEARHFFRQLMAGIHYIHTRGICHRDLKLEHLMLIHDQQHGDKCIKIIDFGLSATIRDEYLITPCGSPHFSAPELVAGKPYKGDQADVWSCGVILYGLLCGSLPFHDDAPALFTKIKNGEYDVPNYLSRSVRKLVRGILEVNAENRETVEGIRTHSFVTMEPKKWCCRRSSKKKTNPKITPQDDYSESGSKLSDSMNSKCYPPISEEDVHRIAKLYDINRQLVHPHVHPLPRINEVDLLNTVPLSRDFVQQVLFSMPARIHINDDILKTPKSSSGGEVQPDDHPSLYALDMEREIRCAYKIVTNSRTKEHID